MIRLAIGIPVYDRTHAKFTLSLANAIAHFFQCRMLDSDGNDLPREVEVFMVSSSLLTEGRTRIVGEALRWGATHLLWMDADHTFPCDAIPRLLSHGLEIVGCNYPRRHSPTAPTAARIEEDEDGNDHNNLVYTTREKAEAGEVEEIAHLGFGLCLMDMRVLDLLQVHAEKHGDGNFLPLFEMHAKPDKGGIIGEDVFFFGKCRAAGAKVYCDHGLSWEVGHLYETILTNAHANVQEEKWKEMWSKRGEKFAKAIEEMV